jgi:hypothetical protein
MYIPFLFVTPDAELVIGVHVDDEPVIVTWSLRSGLREVIGPYRHCGRPPDMVVLSENGRSLVIGCDLGIEIWQID